MLMIRTIDPIPPSTTLLRSRREKSIAASLTDRARTDRIRLGSRECDAGA